MAAPDTKTLDAVMDGWLVKDGHEYPLVVQFEDTDAGGIVYHANYINFAERARTALLRICNVYMQELIDRDVVIIVRRVAIDYKKPSFMGERLMIISDEFTLGKASFTIRQTVRDEDGNVRAAMQVDGAFVAMSIGRPIRVPADVREKMEAVIAQAAAL